MLDLDLVIKVTHDFSKHPLHYATFALAKFDDATFNINEIHLQKNTVFDLDLRIEVIQHVAKYPLHHVAYAHVKFEVATSDGLGGDVFTRKYII